MYSDRIEGLIKAALTDGVLTDKEKQILFKRAQEEGIDRDELEMVLEAKLLEREKDTFKTSSRHSTIRKCPACGALLPDLAIKCPECGYESSNFGPSKSYQPLADKIKEIEKQGSKRKLEIRRSGKFSSKKADGDIFSPLEEEELEIESEISDEISNTITYYPIPNNKEELFEFISYLQSHVKGKYKEEYKKKLSEAIIKAKSLYPDDKVMHSLVSEHISQVTELERRKRIRTLVIIPLGIILSVAIAYFEFTGLKCGTLWKFVIALCTVPMPLIYAIIAVGASNDFDDM